ncbi:hypothetical protein KC345_g11376, partial [Hortaea werneckii]
MPKEVFGDDYAFLPAGELLTFEEILRLTKLFVSLGVSKIRLTGGEPLMRRNLPELVAGIGATRGVEDMGLTTNGVLLGGQAVPLYAAGLRRLNVSLDALDPERFGRMNGRGYKPGTILRHIDHAVEAGFEVKVNMVVQRGVNESEIEPMAAYFKNKKITLRFIEFMDAGNDNGWSYDKVVTKKEILQRLQTTFELEALEHSYFGEVAQRYGYKGSQAQVGFITSVSESFCSSCTRARLSSDGKLYTCLFATDGFDLRAMLRSGADDEGLLAAIKNVWEQRRDRYSDERTEQTRTSRAKIGMSYIGGRRIVPMNGAELLIEMLIEKNIETIFGYPGGAVLPIYDALYDCDRIQHVLVRHEQAAVHAADGYSRATGRPGVALVTSGPGATNAVTGIATAFMDSVPLIVLTGQVSTDLIGLDSFQEVDIYGMTMPVTKHNYI